MSQLTRRQFIHQATLGTAAALTLGGCANTSWRAATATATDRVVLGNCGLKVPRLAMGTGTRGWKKVSDQTNLGKEQFTYLMEHGVNCGAAFIDSADLYGSHEYIKHSLKSIPRDKVILLSKIWYTEAPEMTPTETAKPEVERFLKEMGVDYIDIVLIHCTTDGQWPDKLERMRDELSEMKEKGYVRAVGCSCHTHAALKTASQHPWVDVILARINPRHVIMDDDASVIQTVQVLRQARANGKGLLGMKIYGCGGLTNPDQRIESLNYVIGNNLVDAITIGYTAPAQLDDTITNINRILQA